MQPAYAEQIVCDCSPSELHWEKLTAYICNRENLLPTALLPAYSGTNREDKN
ncbi:MAG: hypothetical protein ACQESM_08040 [Bacteroidota bacterium]